MAWCGLALATYGYCLDSYGPDGYGLDRYGLGSYGLYRYGLPLAAYSYRLDTYDLYSYDLYSYGLYGYGRYGLPLAASVRELTRRLLGQRLAFSIVVTALKWRKRAAANRVAGAGTARTDTAEAADAGGAGETEKRRNSAARTRSPPAKRRGRPASQ